MGLFTFFCQQKGRDFMDRGRWRVLCYTGHAPYCKNVAALWRMCAYMFISDLGRLVLHSRPYLQSEQGDLAANITWTQLPSIITSENKVKKKKKWTVPRRHCADDLPQGSLPRHLGKVNRLETSGWIASTSENAVSPCIRLFENLTLTEEVSHSWQCGGGGMMVVGYLPT